MELFILLIWLLFGRLIPIPFVGITLFLLLKKLKPNYLVFTLFLMGYVDDVARGKPLGMTSLIYSCSAIVLLMIGKSFRGLFPLLSFSISMLISGLLMWWWGDRITIGIVTLFVVSYFVVYMLSKVRGLTSREIYVRQ